MYIPQHFDEPNIHVMQTLIRAHPLATLVTSSSNGLDANHIPLHLADDGSAFGVLQGHVARANPICNDDPKEVEVLAIFQGANAYISPSWYPTKQETGKVVPTWNYTAVHAYGFMRFIDDAAWLRKQLEALTSDNEAAFAEPWAVADAPFDFTEQLIGHIVGIEIAVTRLLGKWKMSQNQMPQNQTGVIQGLLKCDQANAAAIASEIAAAVENVR